MSVSETSSFLLFPKSRSIICSTYPGWLSKRPDIYTLGSEDLMVCAGMNLIDKIETKLPEGYNLRPLEVEDYHKGTKKGTADNLMRCM